jgi:hypothetical protein
MAKRLKVGDTTWYTCAHNKAHLDGTLFLYTGSAFAQNADKEEIAVVELGGAASWNFDWTKVRFRARADGDDSRTKTS